MVSEQDKKSGRIALLLWSADDNTPATVLDLVRQSGHLLECERSYAGVEHRLQADTFDSIIIDIDSLSIANRDLAKIATSYPRLPIICISEHRLHPNLEESIAKHIFACMSKPIDRDEFDYWLKCIRTDGRKSLHS